MSMIAGRFGPATGEPGTPVARYSSYEGAQKAVSRLIAAEIPAREIAIVGTGLRSVERVTGKLGYATAARSGAINGMLLGLLFAAILVIGTPTVPIQAFVGVLFLGIALGMLMSLVTYSLVRRRRDYVSVMQVVAENYEVTVTGASLVRARQVLGVAESPAARPAAERPAAVKPPQYGERVDPAPAPPSDRPAPAKQPAPQGPPPASSAPPTDEQSEEPARGEAPASG